MEGTLAGVNFGEFITKTILGKINVCESIHFSKQSCEEVNIIDRKKLPLSTANKLHKKTIQAKALHKEGHCLQEFC